MGKGKRRENDQEEKEKMAMRLTRVRGQVVFGLQVAPPPLSSALQSRNLLSTVTSQSMLASNYPLATARHIFI